ncbi:MAG: hypothetical protein AB8G77_16985 [Rhodothermales bacterium]
MRNNIMHVQANTLSGMLTFDNARLLKARDSSVIDIIAKSSGNEVHTFRLKSDRVNMEIHSSEIDLKFNNGEIIRSFHSVFVEEAPIGYEPNKGWVDLKKIS